MRGRQRIVGAIVIVALVLAVAARRGQGAHGLVLNTVAFTAPPGGNNTVTLVGLPATSIQTGRVAVDERAGRVFVAPGFANEPVLISDSAAVYLLDADSGALLRRIVPREPVTALVPDEAAGAMLLLQPAATAIGRLDARTGRVLPAIPLTYPPGVLAVDPSTGLAYAAGLSLQLAPVLSVLNARTGRVLHTIPLGVGRPMWIAVDSRAGRIFVGDAVTGSGPGPGGDTTRIDVLAAGSGRMLSALTVRGAAASAALDTRRDRLYIVRNTDVLVVDARRGALLRTIATATPGRVRVFMPPTVWQYIADYSISRLAVDERSGHVLFIPPQGNAMALLSERRVLRLIPWQAPFAAVQIGISADVDARRGTFIVGTDHGVLMIDGATGRVAQRLARVSGNDVAVDASNGHAFVLDAQSRQVTPPDLWSWLPANLRRRLPVIPRPPAPSTEPGSVTTLTLPHP